MQCTLAHGQSLVLATLSRSPTIRYPHRSDPGHTGPTVPPSCATETLTVALDKDSWDAQHPRGDLVSTIPYKMYGDPIVCVCVCVCVCVFVRFVCCVQSVKCTILFEYSSSCIELSFHASISLAATRQFACATHSEPVPHCVKVHDVLQQDESPAQGV